MGTEFVAAYRPIRREATWTIEFSDWTATNPVADVNAVRKCLDDIVARPSDGLFPAYLWTAKPNQVVSARETLSQQRWLGNSVSRELLPELGFSASTCYDLRMLCVHQGLILGWIGSYQHRPYDPMQRALFRSLSKTILSHTIIEHKLAAAELHEMAFIAAVERIPEPAFLVDNGCNVLFANDIARQRLDSEPVTTRKWLREAVSRLTARRHHGQIYLEVDETTVSRLSPSAVPEHYLVTDRRQLSRLARSRSELACTWRLSPRQTEVLLCLLDGCANKEVAARLACSLRTAEHHVTAVFRRIGVTSRSELFARVLAH